MKPAEDRQQGATASGPRLRVVRGGVPTPAESAAMALALTPSVRGGGESSAAWRRAAMLEGAGERVLHDPGELREASHRRGC